MCADCHFQIVELQKLINTTRILDRLFTGLKQVRSEIPILVIALIAFSFRKTIPT